jgi:hypothetical protein
MGTWFILRLDQMDIRVVHWLVGSLASSLHPTITSRGDIACLPIILFDLVCIAMGKSHKLMLDCCDSCVRQVVFLVSHAFYCFPLLMFVFLPQPLAWPRAPPPFPWQ